MITISDEEYYRFLELDKLAQQQIIADRENNDATRLFILAKCKLDFVAHIKKYRKYYPVRK